MPCPSPVLALPPQFTRHLVGREEGVGLFKWKSAYLCCCMAWIFWRESWLDFYPSRCSLLSSTLSKMAHLEPASCMRAALSKKLDQHFFSLGHFWAISLRKYIKYVGKMFSALFVDAFPRSISNFSELLHSVIYKEDSEVYNGDCLLFEPCPHPLYSMLHV